MGRPISRFVVKALPHADDKALRPHMIARCHICHIEATILLTKECGSVPAEVGAKMFRKIGWGMGANRNKDECPTCHTPLSDEQKAALAAKAEQEVQAEQQAESARRAAVLAHAQTLAAASAVKIRPKLNGHAKNGGEARTFSAADAQREQHRRILDSVDAQYDHPHGHYRGVITDADIAAHLDVPAEWVAVIREMFCGPHRSEFDPHLFRSVNALKGKLSDLEGQIEQALSRFADEAAAIKTSLETALERAKDARADVAPAPEIISTVPVQEGAYA